MKIIVRFAKFFGCFFGRNLRRIDEAHQTDRTILQAEYGRADAVHLSTIGGMKFRKALIIFL